MKKYDDIGIKEIDETIEDIKINPCIIVAKRNGEIVSILPVLFENLGQARYIIDLTRRIAGDAGAELRIVSLKPKAEGMRLQEFLDKVVETSSTSKRKLSIKNSIRAERDRAVELLKMSYNKKEVEDFLKIIGEK